MLTLNSLRQKSFSRAIKVVLKTEAESKAFSLAFQRWKHQVISGKAGLSFHDLFQIISAVRFAALFWVISLMLVLIPTYIALNVSTHIHSVKQLPSALVNFRVLGGLLTCIVVSHAHLTLQSNEISEEFYFHMYLNFTFMKIRYMFFVISRTCLFLLCICTARSSRVPSIKQNIRVTWGWAWFWNII